uniref:Transport and golgi organization 6 homolog n=1 Tax=Latimeria chalumnae TaxID=7897 RepID=H3AEV0_LATCH
SVGTSQQAALLETLKQNLSVAEEKLQKDPRYKELKSLREQITSQTKWLQKSEDVMWNFVSEVLVTLLCLKQGMIHLVAAFCPSKPNLRTPEAAPPLPPDTLSISQQKTVQSALQFVVTLGLCPYLSSGVGIPLKRRSAFGAMVEGAVSRDLPPSGTHRLYVSCSVLLDVAQHPSLGNLVLTLHLGDIIAGLCQLGYSPKMTKAKLIKPQTDRLSEEERASCKQLLRDVLDRVYQPIVIRELLILQGGPKQKKEGVRSELLVQAPAWLRRLCGQLLSERLMKPKGVHAVVRAILEGAGAGAVGGRDAEAVAADWRKCDAVARILASCPQQSLSVEDYYVQVCPQVLDFLHIQDKLTARQFQRVATTTLLSMVREHPKLSAKHLLQPLLVPLSSCLETTELVKEDQHPGTVFVEESSLTRCIEDVYKVYVVGNAPHPVLLQSLQTVLCIVFSLYCFTKQNVSHLRWFPCQEILLWFLQKSEASAAIEALKHFAGLKVLIPTIHPLCQFKAGDEGGAIVCIRKTISEHDEDEILYQKVSSDQWRVECLADLLSFLQESDLPGDFFIYCLKVLNTVAVEEGDDCSVPPSCDSLLDLEHYQMEQVVRQEERLLILQLVAVMCEKLTNTVFKNVTQVIEFITVTLQRACTCLEHNIEGTVEAQTLSMGMGLMAAILGGAVQLKSEDYAAMKKLLPLLEQISTQHPEPVIQELASDLRVTIATHRAVATETVSRAASRVLGKKGPEGEVNSPACSKCGENVTKTDDATHRLNVEATSTRLVPGAGVDTEKTGLYSDRQTPSTDRNDGQGSRRDMDEGHFQEILVAAVDPEVPTRAAALRTIAHLIEQKNLQAVHCQDKILSVFLENLEHEDSFVYLSAIQGLALLSDVYPERILPRLLEKYGESMQGQSPETRMKVGEVLMRATRALGDMAPYFRDPLVHAFLRGARDADVSLRASSLSNLGELCQRLCFALGPLLHEVVSCLTAIIKTDREAEVRRAAVHVVTLLLRGLSEKATQVLGDVLRDLYRLLKFVVQVDHDDVAVLHAQLALEELDEVMRRLLFPEQKLEKKIVVLP